MSVSMFYGKNEPAAIVAIKHRRAPLAPRTLIPQTIITQHRCLLFITMNGHPAFFTNQTTYEWCFAPTRSAEAKITFYKIAASHASGRKKELKRRLKLVEHGPIVSCMSSVPQMTDRIALTRQRRRAQDRESLFLQTAALEEVQDRLTLVNKAFTKVAIVTPFPEIWERLAPNAHLVPDEETLSLEEAGHDLVIHALCLHWTNDPVGQIIQCRRALENNGLFMCVTFGGQTLHELRASLAEAETEIRGGMSPRVAPMAEIRDLGAVLQRGGLALPVVDTVPLRVTYETPWHLYRELRDMGESNALTHRARHFSRRDVFIRASEIYTHSFMDAGRIPATFELLFLTGWAPDESQPKPLRPGSAQQKLADALGVAEQPLKD